MTHSYSYVYCVITVILYITLDFIKLIKKIVFRNEIKREKMSRAAGAIRVVRSRVKKIRAPQRQALTFTPAAITKLQVQIF